MGAESARGREEAPATEAQPWGGGGGRPAWLVPQKALPAPVMLRGEAGLWE